MDISTTKNWKVVFIKYDLWQVVITDSHITNRLVIA